MRQSRELGPPRSALQLSQQPALRQGGLPASQAGQGSAVSQQVHQKASGARTGDDRPQDLIDLTEALDDSNRVIGYYEKYIRGEMSQEDAQGSLEEIGNAAIGVTEAGRRHPPIVQKALEEAEAFHAQDVLQMIGLILYTPSYPSRDFWVAKYKIEIERQQRFNEILREYARGIVWDRSAKHAIPLTDIRLYRGF